MSHTSNKTFAKGVIALTSTAIVATTVFMLIEQLQDAGAGQSLRGGCRNSSLDFVEDIHRHRLSGQDTSKSILQLIRPSRGRKGRRRLPLTPQERNVETPLSALEKTKDYEGDENEDLVLLAAVVDDSSAKEDNDKIDDGNEEDDNEDKDDKDEKDDKKEGETEDLEVVGADSLFETFPLGACQGSCFYDTDCMEGLRCFQRDGYEEVPGCSGQGKNSANYCISDANWEAVVSNAPLPATMIPSDEQALLVTTVPSMAETPTATVAASDAGTADATMNSSSVLSELNSSANLQTTTAPSMTQALTASSVGSGYSTVESTMESSSVLGAVSSTAESLPRPQIVGSNNLFEVYPLTVCLGECDSDIDCMEGLKCFQRTGNEPVPGCDPGVPGRFAADYCVDAGFVASAFVEETSEGLTARPTAIDFTSYNTTESPTIVAGSTVNITGGTFNEGAIEPLPKPQVVGNSNIFDIYPLTACLGDCDTDQDCIEGLQCLQRDGDELLPGCDPSAPGKHAVDYCVDAEYIFSDILEEALVVPVNNSTGDSDIIESEGFADGNFGNTMNTTVNSTIAGGSATVGGSATTQINETVIPAELDKEETMAPSFSQPQVLDEQPLAPSFSPLADSSGNINGATLEGSGNDSSQNPSEVLIEGGWAATDTTSQENPEWADETEFPSFATTLFPTIVQQDVPETIYPPTELTIAVTDELEDSPSPIENTFEDLQKSLTIVFDPVSLLVECQGDCNSHNDCAEGLFCYHRNGNEMPVPGCTGSVPAFADFCVDKKFRLDAENDAEVETDAEAEMEKEDEAWEEEVALVRPPVTSPTPVPSQAPSESAYNDTILAAVGILTDELFTSAPTGVGSTASSQQLTLESSSSTSELSEAKTISPSTETTMDSTLFSSTKTTNEVDTLDTPTVSPTTEDSSTIVPNEGASKTVLPNDEALETISPSAPVTEEASDTTSPSFDLSSSVVENAKLNPTDEPSTTENPPPEVSTTISPSNSSEEMPYIRMVGNDGIFDSYPLAECEGDCDVTEDCIGSDLICFQRIADESLPGCRGLPRFSVDYCVKKKYFVDNGNGMLITIQSSLLGAGFGE